MYRTSDGSQTGYWDLTTKKWVPAKEYAVVFFFEQRTAYEIGLGIPAEPLFRSGDLCLVLLLAVLLLLLLVAPCLNCLEAVKKPPPVAFKVMCLLPITIL